LGQIGQNPRNKSTLGGNLKPIHRAFEKTYVCLDTLVVGQILPGQLMMMISSAMPLMDRKHLSSVFSSFLTIMLRLIVLMVSL
jgi:hypothetical protein